MSSPRIISDFDGVLTELAHEAERVREIFYEIIGIGKRRDLQSTLENWIQSQPEKWGWEVEGRITAYSDEDGFIFNNALAMALDHLLKNPEMNANLSHSLNLAGLAADVSTRGFANFKGISVAAYNQMVEEVKSSTTDSPMEENVPDVLRSWGAQGYQVTIVSNSGTTRIEDILKKSGLGVPQFLQIQGGAQKFSLGERPEWLDFGGRRVDVNRPRYREILTSVKPCAVIGDVFSLDLALPLALATQGSLGNRPITLVLRERPYTPQWIRDWAKTWIHPTVRMIVSSDLSKISSYFS